MIVTSQKRVAPENPFPSLVDIKEKFKKNNNLFGKEGFIKAHNTLINSVEDVLKVVSKNGDEIPAELARELGIQIRHTLNAENMTLEQYHKGTRYDLTIAAYNSIKLILTAAKPQIRITSAELGLQTISALKGHLKD